MQSAKPTELRAPGISTELQIAAVLPIGDALRRSRRWKFPRENTPRKPAAGIRTVARAGMRRGMLGTCGGGRCPQFRSCEGGFYWISVSVERGWLFVLELYTFGGKNRVILLVALFVARDGSAKALPKITYM